MLKKLRVFFKILTLLVITIVLGYSFFFVKNFKFEKSSNRDFNELKKVQFSTNGTITSKWLANNLGLKKGLDLFDLDILEIRTKLENVQQIKDVSIEKNFPDGTKIVNYADGTIRNVYNDGVEEVFFNDGSLQKVDKNGIITVEYSDGIQDTIYPDESKIMKYPDGRITKINSDGTIIEQ